MQLSGDLASLLEQAIEAYAYRDFGTASQLLEKISVKYPENWTARYFYAMTLCATGDYSESRQQLYHIVGNSGDPIWQKVSKNGLNLVDYKEQSLRSSLERIFQH